MIVQRVITAVILILVATLVVLFAPAQLFAVLTATLCLGATWEWSQLAGLVSPFARAVAVVVLTALFILLWWLRNPVLWLLLLLAGTAWWLLACAWLRHISFGAAPTRENRRLKLLAGVFVIVPAWIAIQELHNNHCLHHNVLWILLVLFTIWGADTAAYFSGRRFGRRKLAPQISPGKTWAGAYAGVPGGMAISVLSGYCLLGLRGWPLLGLMLLGLLTAVASIVGDLLESLLKRHARQKDSGSLIPGHGGLLDRLDSLFAALPIFTLGLLILQHCKVIS